MADRPGLWGSAEAYERYMGRWSRDVAPRFVAWLQAPPDAAWLDVGCGTGALSGAILAHARPSRVVGVDSARGFLDVAASRIGDDRFETREADAGALPFDDGAFDVAACGLVLNFVPDGAGLVAQLRRVVRPGGLVGLYVWDYAGHMQVMRRFFDAAEALDPRARDFDDGIRAPVCRPTPLAALLASAGLSGVAVRAIDIPAAFDTFDDYWSPFLGGTGSAPKYLASLAPDAQAALREKVRERVPVGPDGEILLAVRAWAVKGTVAAAR